MAEGKELTCGVHAPVYGVVELFVVVADVVHVTCGGRASEEGECPEGRMGAKRRAGGTAL